VSTPAWISHEGGGVGSLTTSPVFDQGFRSAGRLGVRLSRRGRRVPRSGRSPSLLVGSVGPGSGWCGQSSHRVPGIDQVGGPGPVPAQVEPPFSLPGRQASRYVQEPEPQQFGAAWRRSPSGRARWRKQASRFATRSTTWVHATSTAQCREGHRFSPGALACLTSFSMWTWERWRVSSQAICPALVLVAISW
jgi:hypothetical protein